MPRQSLAPALLSQKDKSTFLLFIVLIYFQNMLQLSLCFQTCFQRVFWKQWIMRLCFFWLKQRFKPSWHWLVQNQRKKYCKTCRTCSQWVNNEDSETMSVFIAICWTCHSPGASISIVDLKQEKYANINIDYATVISSKILHSESSKVTLVLQNQ